MGDITKLSTIYTNSNKCTVLSLLKEVCSEIDNNHTALKDSIDSNTTNITNENINRRNADSNLQTQINNIKAQVSPYYMHNILIQGTTDTIGIDVCVSFTILTHQSFTFESGNDFSDYLHDSGNGLYNAPASGQVLFNGTYFTISYIMLDASGDGCINKAYCNIGSVVPLGQTKDFLSDNAYFEDFVSPLV